MILITKTEMLDIENIRKELCQTSYLCNSHQTQKLYKITHKKRNLKYLWKTLLNFD